MIQQNFSLHLIWLRLFFPSMTDYITEGSNFHTTFTVKSTQLNKISRLMRISTYQTKLAKKESSIIKFTKSLLQVIKSSTWFKLSVLNHAKILYSHFLYLNSEKKNVKILLVCCTGWSPLYEEYTPLVNVSTWDIICSPNSLLAGS